MEIDPKSVARTARQQPSKARSAALHAGGRKPSKAKGPAVPSLSRAPVEEPGASSLSVSSSKLKNQFGEVMTRAISGQPVYITNRDQPAKVVLISTEKYHALVNREKRALERLTGEFDAMLEAMQTETARAAVDGLFAASSEQLGRAAVEAARRKEK